MENRPFTDHQVNYEKAELYICVHYSITHYNYWNSKRSSRILSAKAGMAQ